MGWMGGTFDPIHRGHIQIARAITQSFLYDEMLLLPAGEPGHKKAPQASIKQRVDMATLAKENEPFSVSLLDAARIGTTYTVDTLRCIHQHYPKHAHDFIIGADSLMQLSKWREPEAILKLARLVVIGRPGIDQADVKAQAEHVMRTYGGEVLVSGIEGPDISSSMIRQAVQAHEAIDRWVPERVVQYIYENGLYLTP